MRIRTRGRVAAISCGLQRGAWLAPGRRRVLRRFVADQRPWRQTNFQAHAAIRRLDHELAAEGAHSLFDDDRSLPRAVEIGLRQAAREVKATAVVVDDELRRTRLEREPHDDVAGTAVFSHVHQRFLRNARQLVTYGRRECDLLDLRHEPRRDAGLAPKAIDQLLQMLEQLSRGEVGAADTRRTSPARSGWQAAAEIGAAAAR